MPLNPPSYAGQDVWYSPDVYVNKVQVALWQPPQTREPVSDPLTQAMIYGCEIDSPGTAESANRAAAYHQALVQQGLMTQGELDTAMRTQPNGSEPRNGGNPASPPSFQTDTQGVQNLTDYPLELQLSRNFTLGQLTARPYVEFQHIIPPSGANGLTRGQLVANLKLLASNCLDPIRDRYPDMRPSNSWRPGSGQSQHGLGQAADLKFYNTPKSRWYDIAVWIKDNIPFDQLLLEYKNVGPPTCWIHISFAGAQNRPAEHPAKFGTFLNDVWCTNGRRNLINLAPTIGLSP